MKGFIQLSRQILDMFKPTNKKFTKCEAYIDLCQEVNFTEKKLTYPQNNLG